MTELMNLEMVLPAPLNPPFPERAKMSELGRVHFSRYWWRGYERYCRSDAAGWCDGERF